jgi:CheY-like chemotaxis protein
LSFISLRQVRQFWEWEAKHRVVRQYIIGISAHAGGKDAERGLQSGMDDFLQKPIAANVLGKLCESTCMKSLPFVSRFSFYRAATDIATTECFAKRAKSDQKFEIEGTDSCTKNWKASDSVEPMDEGGDHSEQRHCLFIFLAGSGDKALVAVFEANGWICNLSTDSAAAFRQLRQRNWDTVLVDSALQPLQGFDVIARFRNWESQNRYNRQNHVYWLDCNEADWNMTTVHTDAPFGFDGLLNRSL